MLVFALILGAVYALSPRTPLAPWASGWTGPSTGRRCTLDAVLDGDSLRLRCQGESVEVRLHCIDAPEYEQAPWGKQSRRHLVAITPRRLELAAMETDRFGRTVAKVYTTGANRRLLNLEQVVSGNAAVYGQYCSDPAFAQAERAARAARLGIWSRPGEQQTPWVYRHRQGH
ncbi:MAG TPA: thermonuclease family protein [Lamprocystis sp. (in: g-proteobacteria)]|nr:thermonuclease family protein [Lamprocystis sp. (in: g-proteobacteria)]